MQCKDFGSFVDNSGAVLGRGDGASGCMAAVKVKEKPGWYHLNHCCWAEEPGRTPGKITRDPQQTEVSPVKQEATDQPEGEQELVPTEDPQERSGKDRA